MDKFEASAISSAIPADLPKVGYRPRSNATEVYYKLWVVQSADTALRSYLYRPERTDQIAVRAALSEMLVRHAEWYLEHPDEDLSVSVTQLDFVVDQAGSVGGPGLMYPSTDDGEQGKPISLLMEVALEDLQSRLSSS